MQDARHVGGFGPLQKFKGVRFGLTRVQHDWPLQLRGEGQLRIESVQLTFAGSMLVMGIESTFPNRNGTVGDGLTN